MENHTATEFAVVSPFEDGDENQSTNFSFPLEDDDLRSGQLGSHAYRNFNESHKSSPRELITGKKTSAYYFHAKCRYQYGMFKNSSKEPFQGAVTDLNSKNSTPAALIMLDCSFQERAPAGSRFKMAEVELEFYDATSVLLNPHESDIDEQYVPTVLQFEPHHFQGPVVSALGQTGKQIGISLSDPTNTFSINPSISRTTPFMVEGPFRIHGVVENDPPSKIHWVIREDKLKRNGIRPEISLAAIVSYTPGRRFAARVRIKADVAFPFVRPVAGAKDDPLYFEPEAKDVILPLDLKSLTKLDAFGGTWSV